MKINVPVYINKVWLFLSYVPYYFYLTAVETLEIEVDTTTAYQKIIGFGGAFTDATGLNILSLPEPMQEMILR